MRTNTTDPTYRGLYKAGSLALLLSGILLLIYAGTLLILGPAPSPIVDYLTFLGANYLLVIIGMSFLTAALVLLIPAIFALYHALKPVSIGRTLIGSGILMSGIIVFLSNVGNYFWLVNIGLNYGRSCVSSCVQINQTLALATAALATSSVVIDFYIAILLIILGILVLSLAMLKSPIFGKAAGYLGIIAGIFSLVVPSVQELLYLNLSLSAYPLVASFLLYGIWALLAGSKLYKIR